MVQGEVTNPFLVKANSISVLSHPAYAILYQSKKYP